jgi:hypothetical protein
MFLWHSLLRVCQALFALAPAEADVLARLKSLSREDAQVCGVAYSPLALFSLCTQRRGCAHRCCFWAIDRRNPQNCQPAASSSEWTSRWSLLLRSPATSTFGMPRYVRFVSLVRAFVGSSDASLWSAKLHTFAVMACSEREPLSATQVNAIALFTNSPHIKQRFDAAVKVS